MIQNNFNFYLEKTELIKEIEELKTNLQLDLYNEGIFDIIAGFFGNFKFNKWIEQFKSDVIKNFTNTLLKSRPNLVVLNMNAEYRRYLQKLEKENLDESLKDSIANYTQNLLNNYIRKVVLKEKNSPDQNLKPEDKSELESDLQKIEVPEATPKEKTEIEQILTNSKNEVDQLFSFGDTTTSTSELPEDIENLITLYLRGGAPGNSRQLIKELVAMSKDPKVRQSGNSIRGVINLLSGLVLMTRKAANSEDVRAIRNLILDIRRKLTASNKLISEPVQAPVKTPK